MINLSLLPADLVERHQKAIDRYQKYWNSDLKNLSGQPHFEVGIQSFALNIVDLSDKDACQDDIDASVAWFGVMFCVALANLEEELKQ